MGNLVRHQIQLLSTKINVLRRHSRLSWMSPAFYTADRRSAALRYTDGSAPRTATITAQMGNVERQSPIVAG